MIVANICRQSQLPIKNLSHISWLINPFRAGMSSSNYSNVFVYGTLKNGEPNHYWLSDKNNGYSKFISAGKTVEKFPLVVGTRYYIPFLLNKKGVGNRIEGEVYEVDESMFGKLDELENYPEFYDREMHDIQIGDGETVSCWLYMMKNYPDSLLTKNLLTCYRNCEEYPYCESYSDSEPTVDEMIDDLAVDYGRKGSGS